MRHYTEMVDYVDTLTIPTMTTTKKITYLNIESGFDIETTSTTVNGEKVAFMYVWQIGIGYGNDVFYGRTWGELVELLHDLSLSLELDESKRLVIYVHNLAYEFQFMRKFFDWVDVFAISDRKPIRALSTLGIEFRCSLILSGYSLENTAKNLQTHTIKKLMGDLDYDLIRTSETPLTDDEINYCTNDIQIVNAYINEQITHSGDINEIPMTNTGRVRKYVKNRCFTDKGKSRKKSKGTVMKYKKIMSDLTLDAETYQMLKAGFMGGFTHANALYTGEVLENVSSIDFTSSYPSVMIAEKFPMSRFKDSGAISMNDLHDLMNNERAVIFTAKFENITATIDHENYLSESKCHNLKNAIINNGRVVEAESFFAVMTETDYMIMRQCYDFELTIIKSKWAYKDYLPKAIISSILELYQGKTELKDVIGKEVEYLLSKGMLNSVYGMAVTDIVKEQTKYTETDEWIVEQPDLDHDLEKYNQSHNRFLYYPWGVWVTAYARRNLWTGIIAVGDDYVYSDTDSLKVLNYTDHLEYIKKFDDNIILKMQNTCKRYDLDENLLSPKTVEGVTKMLGVWDYEGTYSRFKTLGAKRYLVENNNRLALTVAGLSKSNGLNYMLEICDNDHTKVFELFNNKLHIPENRTGKLTHTYIDHDQTFEITDYLGNKTVINSLSSVHLSKCEFTLSMSDGYLNYLEQIINGTYYTGETE